MEVTIKCVKGIGSQYKLKTANYYANYALKNAAHRHDCLPFLAVFLAFLRLERYLGGEIEAGRAT